MEQLFNQMVRFLARRGFFRGKLLVALDGSKLPTPKSYEGCGKLKQTRSVKIKGQKEAATEEYCRVWMESPGPHRGANAPAPGDETGQNPGLRGEVADPLAGAGPG